MAAFSRTAFAITAFSAAAFAIDPVPPGAAVTPNTIASLGNLFKKTAYGVSEGPISLLGKPSIRDLKLRAAAEKRASDLSVILSALHLLDEMDE